MENNLTISKTISEEKSLNYDLLKAEGIQHIEQLAGKIWTDYNEHDPGITILEILSYAITDLGYRTNLNIEDLLAQSGNNLQGMHEQFLSAKRILPNCSLTENDYRKLFIDIPEIKNAWLSNSETTYFLNCKTSEISRTQPALATHPFKPFTLKGIYKVAIELMDNVPATNHENIKQKVLAAYHANRNLCEDIDPNILIIPKHEILICSDIELEPEADIETVYAEILFKVQDHLSPSVQRYTLQELLDKGIHSEDIFEGPLLENGFIDDNELESSQLKSEVHISDLINVISKIEGVKTIKKILLNYCSSTERTEEQEEKWSISIKPGHQATLCNGKSVFNFFKDILPFRSNKAEVLEKLQQLQINRQIRLENIGQAVDDLKMPIGTYRNVSEYSSIQNDFPEFYGITQVGLSPGALNPEAKNKRKAQARQLQAYLLFFDQILANYLSQLSNVKSLLSTNSNLSRTYLTQVIATSEIKEIDQLFDSYGELDSILAHMSEERTDGKLSDRYARQHNLLLNHLIARFGENFNEYVLLMHSLFDKKRADLDLILDKKLFLKDYEFISQNRAKAMDVCNAFFKNINGDPILDDSEQPIPKKVWYEQDEVNLNIKHINTSGFQHRVSRLVGIHNYKNRDLSSIEFEIYEEVDSDDESEPRFRVIDKINDKILLSSSQHFVDKELAEQEMKTAIQLGMSSTNYQLLVAENGTFYFNIIDNNNEVVARRIEFFDTEEERQEAINYLINFLNEKFSDEGFYLIEHLLLQPRKDNDNFLPVCAEEDCTTCAPLDPYSFRVSVVLPGYTPRFNNMDFRAYFEKIIRQELPAHILAKICWIGVDQMQELETNYHAWLDYQHGHLDGNQPSDTNESLNELIDTINKLYTIYHKGTLHDCEDGNEENPIVLGRTHIGDLDPLINTEEPDPGVVDDL